jgi:hypothetical protein
VLKGLPGQFTPDKKNGRWYLAVWYVEQLTTEYARDVILQRSPAGLISGPILVDGEQVGHQPARS